MSIAEKTLQLKQDFDDVRTAGFSEGYDEGRQEGYQEGETNGYNEGHTVGVEVGKEQVLSNSKYIPKQATGKFISLTDVSEVSHKVKVYGDAEVEVYGKNLFDISTDTKFTKQEDGSYINNTKIGVTETPLALPYGKYVISYDLKCAVGRNARIQIYLKDGTTVDMFQVSTNEFLHFEQAIVGEIVAWRINFSSAPNQGEVTIKNAQIEVGSIATSYEPYAKQTITATPVGTEITSICPNMTFIAPPDYAETLLVEYYSSYGMNEEWNRFWDSYQDYGKRDYYLYGFSGYGWNDRTFKPKYDIRPYYALSLFNEAKITDLAKLLEEAGVELDLSGITSGGASIFRSRYITRVPYFVMPNIKDTTYMFNGDLALRTIDGMYCNEINTHTSSFVNCTSLTHCIFSGVIANDINLQWSPLLDDESLISLVKCLAWETDGTKTITLHPDCWARAAELKFEIVEGSGAYVTLVEHIDTINWNRA